MAEMAAADAVMASLQILADRGEDPMPAVYQRLFAINPQFRDRFSGDADDAVKGQMVGRTFSAILDFIENRQYARYAMATDMVTHEGYDVPREVFISFFSTLRDGVRDLLADAWTTTFDDAWTRLIGEIEASLNSLPRSDVDFVHHDAPSPRRD